MLEAIILGLIQGLTEFIPVSSSGHLALLPKLFDWKQQSTSFDVFLHGGTLLALLIIYRKTISELLASLWTSLTRLVIRTKPEIKATDTANNKLTVNLIVATVPAAILGFFFQDIIDEKLNSDYITISMLTIVGIVLIIADYLQKKKAKNRKPISIRNALFIGFSQPIAFIRGTSRSGITILAGLSQGISLEKAINFSFLLSIPITALAFSYETLQFILNGAEGEEISHLLIGFITAFISGLFAIQFMLKITRKIGLKWFGFYRILLSIVFLILILK